MVQFNLLPSVKLEFVKARQIKRLLTLISTVVSIVGLVVLLLSFLTVKVVQKKSLNDLNKDISKYSSQLKSVPNLDQILTVQNQLTTLTSLHDQKPVASRLFGYLSQITPAQANLNKLTVDFTKHTLIIGGSAPSLEVVNGYTYTLKSTTYSTTDSKNHPKAFSGVVLSTFSRDAKTANFTITMNFDPIIFNSASTVTLDGASTATSSQSNLFGAGN